VNRREPWVVYIKRGQESVRRNLIAGNYSRGRELEGGKEGGRHKRRGRGRTELSFSHRQNAPLVRGEGRARSTTTTRGKERGD